MRMIQGEVCMTDGSYEFALGKFNYTSFKLQCHQENKLLSSLLTTHVAQRVLSSDREN